MKKAALFSLLLLSGFQASPVLAAPAFPAGMWRVADGSAIIRIAPCGKNVCGVIAAAPPPAAGEKSSVGQKILINLRREGDVWKGPIFNLDDGKMYDGEISAGPDMDHLKVRGCVQGGGLCGGETWKRAR